MLHAIHIIIKLMLLALAIQACMGDSQNRNLEITEITLNISDEMAGENIINTSMVLEEAMVQITQISTFNETYLLDVSAGSSESETPAEDYNPSLFEFAARAAIQCSGIICNGKTLNGRAIVSIDVKRLYGEVNNLDASDDDGNYRLSGSMKSAATNDRLPYLAEANLVFSYSGGNITLDNAATLYIDAGQAEQRQLIGNFIASDNETGLEFIGEIEEAGEIGEAFAGEPTLP